MVLIAAPNDEDWKRRYAFLAGADYTRLTEGEGKVRGPDGYLRLEDRDDSMRGLTVKEAETLLAELDMNSLPFLWIGQVSWFSAGLSGDPDRYVPAPVARIAQIVGAGTVLTRGVAGDIQAAMNLPNRSVYGTRTITRHSPDEYRAIIEANTSPWSRVRGLGHGQILHRKPDPDTHSSGVARRQHVKAWLRDNHESWVVAESW